MIRIPDPGRFELRLMDGSANPYLMQAGIIAHEQGGAQYQTATKNGICPLKALTESINKYIAAFSLQRSQWANGLDEKSNEILNFIYAYTNKEIRAQFDNIHPDTKPWHPYNFHFGNHPKADESTDIMLKNGHIPIPNWVYSDQFDLAQLEKWTERQLQVFEDNKMPLLQIRIKNPSQGKSWSTETVIDHLRTINDVFKAKDLTPPIYYIHSHEINGQAAHVAKETLQWAQKNGFHVVVDTSSSGVTHPRNEIVAEALYLSDAEKEALSKYNELNKIVAKLLVRFDSSDIKSPPFSSWPGGTGSSDEENRQILMQSGTNLSTYKFKEWQESFS